MRSGAVFCLLRSIRMNQLKHLIGLGLLFYGVQIAAHGDPDTALFVAEYGSDQGNCQDDAAPCRSISYALNLIGKGGQIRVAEGSYDIQATEDIFYLVSGAVDIEGGYRFKEQFRPRDLKISILTGVPSQYREVLAARGFHVIADRKGIDKSASAEVQRLVSLHEQLQSSAPATPCVGGSAAGTECDSVDLLSHLALRDVSTEPVSATDVWGFVDLNSNREYAIVGFNNGTGVFDVTVPETPTEVGFISGQNTSWRDVKVYQSFDSTDMRWKAYAYVTADNANDGLVIIDLTGLPHRIDRINYSSDFGSAHNVYVTNTDYGTGLALTDSVPALIIAGPNRSLGQYRAYTLADPASPALVSGTTATQYMHDASSIVITDARKDTQCANSGPYCEVLLDFNENTIDIWDITNPDNPSILSTTNYTNRGYTHSGWWTEDKQFMFVHDELDERNFGLRTTLRVFSLADLRSPSLAATWTGPTAAIDHNGFVRGNRYYMSNYTRGLTVLDISTPRTPAEVGYLDTFPGSNNNSFNGAWGAYPFFFSGTIAISDINTGLYLVEDQTRNVSQGSLSFSQSSFAVAEGQQAQLTVQRTIGNTDSVSVNYHILGATADAADYQVNAGQLTWAAGDASDKSITLTAINDGILEGLERLVVRLINPGGNATLGNGNTASVYLSDPGGVAEIRLTETSIATRENGFGMAVIVLQRTGNALGMVTVDYSVSGGNATAGTDFRGSTSGTVTWTDGDGDPKSLLFDIEEDGINEGPEFFEVTLSNPTGATIAGTAVAVVNIADAPPPRSSGGAMGHLWLWLLVFLFSLGRFNRRGVV